MKLKYNIVDLFVCIMIIAFFIGVGIRFFPIFSINNIQAVNTPKTIEYTVVIRDVRDYTVNALKKAGVAYTSSGTEMGTIIDVWSKPYTDIEVLNDGTQYKLAAPDKYEAYIKIRTEGRESDMLLIGSCGTELYLGGHIGWYTKWVNIISSQIVEIDILE
ncbi:DUF4330 domain-containing protein [Candidatus Epulonipiscium viviparus]|uniref:DUF4330 domain-containing protein n=1 Tax=Candidatus Epulonipiscium viviparus TaxID=420336 RepID=UPI00016C0042|nr:DUF4330 domain-containing protein [Candidatus Epulopiscium viviparus]